VKSSLGLTTSLFGFFSSFFFTHDSVTISVWWTLIKKLQCSKINLKPTKDWNKKTFNVINWPTEWNIARSIRTSCSNIVKKWKNSHKQAQKRTHWDNDPRKKNHTEYNYDMNNELYFVSAEKTKKITGVNRFGPWI